MNPVPMPSAPSLSDKDFGRLAKLISSACGIKMTPPKKTMVQARLQKRLRSLSIDTHDEYCEYLFSPAGMRDEVVNLIDVVTTNKTDFFREPKHFDYLTDRVLPEFAGSSRAGLDRPMNAWSAGCSSGEEPYTLAMVLEGFAERHLPFSYSILATDISTRVLKMAKGAVYRADRVEPVPAALKRKYLLRSRDRAQELVRVVPELRQRVRFMRVNLMQERYEFCEKMDVVFLRNVLIYFERPRQEVLISNICRHMRSGGYLFIGHSETLYGLDVPLEQVAPTIFRKVP